METPPGGGNKRRFENWLRETFAGKVFHFCLRIVFWGNLLAIPVAAARACT